MHLKAVTKDIFKKSTIISMEG